MSLPTFESLSDQARLWIYGFDRDLQPPEAAQVTQALTDFCGQWRSHGRPVTSDSALMDRHFAIIAGEILGGDISGCGIDASVRVFKDLRDGQGLDALKHALVHYRAAGEIVAADRATFQDLVRKGTVDEETIVFDLTIETVGQLRAGRFELPLKDSWHAAAFLART